MSKLKGKSKADYLLLADRGLKAAALQYAAAVARDPANIEEAAAILRESAETYTNLTWDVG